MTFEEFKRELPHASRYYTEDGCYWAEFRRGWISFGAGSKHWLTCGTEPGKEFSLGGSEKPSVETINRVR